jgi:hypothetical protein
MTAEASYVWMYAVVAGDPGPLAGDPTGVGSGRVRAVRAAGLTAIVGDVAEDEFGEAALRRNLEDLDWLEGAARAHHAVIEATWETLGPVVPMRLATVYSGDDAVAETLRRRAGDLREALVRLRARSEWGIKAYKARPADQGPAGQGTGDPGTGPHGRPDGQAEPANKPGTAYLERRRAQLTERRTSLQMAMADAEAVHAELNGLAVSAHLYPPQSPDLAGQPAPMVLNAAYLVADDGAGEFAAAVDELTRRHRSVRLALTGPWPAYSFAGGPDTSEEGQ